MSVQDVLNKVIIPRNSDVLAHFGIRGMKWGVRRTQLQLARASESVRKANELEPDKLYVSGKGRKTRVQSGEAARAAALASVAKKHGPSTLSNKDLEFLNKRLQLQSKYTQLNPKQKSKVAQVIDTVNGLDRATNRVVSTAAKGAAIKFVDKKTGGRLSQIMQVVDKTAAKQRPKQKSQPANNQAEETTKPTTTTQSPIDIVRTQSRRPKEIYDAETHAWKIVED